MFDIEICHKPRIVLIRFRGTFSESDLVALEESARSTAAAEHYDCVFDFTRVDTVDLPTDFVSRRGALPAAFRGRERLYVAPHHDVKLLLRLYSGYQASRGWRESTIVESLAEAFLHFGVTAADFRPHTG
jgi:hypothetical protein